MMSVSVARRLRELHGSKKVLHSDGDLLCYWYDATPFVSYKPDAAVFPIPIPQTKRTFLTLCKNIIDAARTVSATISRRVIPSSHELVDSVAINCVEDHVNMGLHRDVEALLLIESDGHPEAVREDASVIQRACATNNARTLGAAADAKKSEESFTVRWNALTALARVAPTTILEDATVPRTAFHD
jgi:glycolate oxidase